MYEKDDFVEAAASNACFSLQNDQGQSVRAAAAEIH
jgi:hypothetical protein